MLFVEMNKHVTECVQHTEVTLRLRLAAIKAPSLHQLSWDVRPLPQFPFETEHAIFDTGTAYTHGYRESKDALPNGAPGFDTERIGKRVCPVCRGKASLLLSGEAMLCWQCDGRGTI